VKGANPYSPTVAACRLGAGLLFVVVASVASWAQTRASSSISLPTALRVAAPGWWPTKGDARRDGYVGTDVCASCHQAKVQSQRGTAMAHASSLAADSAVLLNHDHLVFQVGPYGYQLLTQGGKSILTVQSETSSHTVELRWGFGSAHMGQTYIYERDDSFYESHVSFFVAPQSLDITPGQPRAAPKSMEDAAGRRMSPEETHQCFGCHMTASTTENHFDPSAASTGVTCEACHGPGAKHVASVRAGTEKRGSGSIFDPLQLDPVESVDFCGACHRTWEDVVEGHLIGIGIYNVRFAPYRLENSRCWKKNDARITCIACHDPHMPLVRDLGSYDANCLECHAVKTRAKRTANHAAACPISTKNCVSCHMPKVEPPNLHSAFTDHWIRIPNPGAAYPD
jgi:Cytochrome c554 and c-prime